MNTPASRRRSRAQLLGLAALFLVPVAISFWLYYGTGWRPAGRTQHGELVSPARPLPALALPKPDGTTTTADFLRGKWSLVYVGDGGCGQACQATLHDSRQVRLALDKDTTRVQRVFLYGGSCCAPGWLEREHPDLIAASVAGADAQPLLDMFRLGPGGDPMTEGRLYVVDPLGNLMMSYGQGAAPKGVLKDLERLLKLSHIG
jgi:hypothetical protein